MVAMSDRSDLEGRQPNDLSPLVGEDHICQECALAYQEISVEGAIEVIHSIPDAVRNAVLAVPSKASRTRPGTGAWSVAEYLCHLRDVYCTYTIRLHRARTEDRPALEPMFNDLRALRFRYNDSNLNAVLDELAATAAGFREEIDHTGSDHWDRVVTRLPSEERTTRWLVRQAMHEGQHHLDDIRKTGKAVLTRA